MEEEERPLSPSAVASDFLTEVPSTELSAPSPSEVFVRPAPPPVVPPPDPLVMLPPQLAAMEPQLDTPEVSLSDSKLYKFRAYEMTVSMQTKWRTEKRLTEKDIFEAGCAAKCCRNGTLEGLQCDRCGRIVFVTPKHTRPEVPVPGVERYRFVVRSRCTSSREHLRSSLVLFLDQLPSAHPVVTKPFVVQARIKKIKHTDCGYRSDSGSRPLPTLGQSLSGGFGGYSSSSGNLSGYSSAHSSYTTEDEGPPTPAFLQPPPRKVVAVSPSPILSQPSPMLPPQNPPFRALSAFALQLQQQHHQQQPLQPASSQSQPSSKNRVVSVTVCDSSGAFQPGENVEIPFEMPSVVKFMRSPVRTPVLLMALEELREIAQTANVGQLSQRVVVLTHDVFMIVCSFRTNKDREDWTTLSNQYFLNTAPGRPNILGVDMYKTALVEFLGDVQLPNSAPFV